MNPKSLSGKPFLAMGLLLLVVWAAGLSCALAQTKVYTFTPDAIPPELTETAMQVAEGETMIHLTFAGDCTLGGEEGISQSAAGFDARVAQRGMEYPFEALLPLFGQDDLTIVNLEGVLSHSKGDKVPNREFNFIGDPAYAAVLTAGSVECVSLANNHALDYGERGFQGTLAALEEEGIPYFDDSHVTVLEKDGVRIGFTGSLFAMVGERQQRLKAQMEALEGVGCQWVAHSLHAGEEYASQPTGRQRSAASYAVARGAGLVVGHHPHVVQGMELLEDVPVLYSLGNCVFGGNTRPKDYDACLLSVSLHFAEGALRSMELTIHPIRISGEKRTNNYQPVLLHGEDAARVMEKLQKSSGYALAPYQEGWGAMQEPVIYDAEEE